ncbi:MAG: nucleotide-diphospho-sugar transferase [Sphingobacteriales bacterium]|uniref:hypothetical protein n=1 Tax=Hydrotalea flava TaxID=714549 RepID=UPI000831C838|nr:hypothetical protein [Hydrotalea flava]RTL55840.1 MAG: nucleotide-diphospho-sugar transferase [Sphingobacteriales bacterium]
MTTPILFLIFNRPELTKITFSKIKEQKPSKLYIAADGFRENKPGEKELCDLTRSIVIDNIDWECEVHTLFRNENLGCGKAVSTAISWFFEHVEFGIILEDDCYPDNSFFSFCQQMLLKYQYHDSIMMVNGTNLLLNKINISDSYYFSRASLIWGWATWRRAWEKYDFNLSRYKDHNTVGLNKWFLFIFNEMLNHRIDTWDYQWFFSIWFNNGICITPKVNLITNLGYGKGSSHSFIKPWWLNKLVYGSIEDINHPTEIKVNFNADDYVLNHVQYSNVYFYKIKKIIKPFVLKLFFLLWLLNRNTTNS